jgi:hypothetical protein
MLVCEANNVMTNECLHYFVNTYSKVYIGALNTYSHD